ncbi:hypothetical protein F3N42_04300 [Marinihelvus fidelis]|uniref:Uncharacterized protein n=1 Tax=Marinihelvus fidelis TaxID=2613842 RepID=A0A5N0TCQ1_9GAMM|nr:hypothetical protein [Marinihelvus fidelis]KAA9132458.1 hypothetical protein F3N42_04300 [Marinihelvus fidelis]
MRQTPRWRQIEIMRERQALRDMLDDFGGDDFDFDFDGEVFGAEEDEELYVPPVTGDELSSGELEDDDYVDEEFDED